MASAANKASSSPRSLLQFPGFDPVSDLFIGLQLALPSQGVFQHCAPPVSDSLPVSSCHPDNMHPRICIPTYPGQDRFSGVSICSHSWRCAQAFPFKSFQSCNSPGTRPLPVAPVTPMPLANQSCSFDVWCPLLPNYASARVLLDVENSTVRI